MAGDETITHWEPSGWTEEKSAPAPFVAYCDAWETRSPLDRAAMKLEDFDYRLVYTWKTSEFGADPHVEISLQQHSDGHMLVDVNREEGYIHRGAVEKKWVGAFMMSGLPHLIQTLSQPAIALHLEKIDRTIRAFVRHGQNRDSIDALGYETLDESEEKARAARWDREWQKQQGRG